ncbi:hypothetical protein EDB80DRAFT_784271 [Ilyonectria destructans]|nr:hypothetical protein EDB80DRAFT_784271 [Ilyonectria destructans]
MLAECASSGTAGGFQAYFRWQGLFSSHLPFPARQPSHACTEKKRDLPPVSGPPPPPSSPTPAKSDEKIKNTDSRSADDSTGDSSDSPVEDWEELYSSDDMTRQPRVTPRQPPVYRDDYDTEEEKMPDPWNAIGIIGIRVYSKNEGLELRTVMEGSELLEGEMGEKGAADLDDAQINAGGVRAEEKDGGDTAKMECKIASYPPVIHKDDLEIRFEAEGKEENPAIGSLHDADEHA